MVNLPSIYLVVIVLTAGVSSSRVNTSTTQLQQFSNRSDPSSRWVEWIECESSWTNDDLMAEILRVPNGTIQVQFLFCNFRDMDFSFLDLPNWKNLSRLYVTYGTLVEFKSMPFLPGLTALFVGVSDFRQWYDPRLTPNLKEIRLMEIPSDAVAEPILNTIRLGYWNQLEMLAFEFTNMTRIPSMVNDFYRLHMFEFRYSSMLKTLPTGTFTARFNPKYIGISDCGLTSIEVGAFQGNYYNRTISLQGLPLERIDQAVFGPVSDSMMSGGGLGKVYISLVPCDCNLAWLLRDNRQYLDHLSGFCLMEEKWTRLELVSLDLFKDCPIEKDIKCTSNWTSSEILTQVQTLPNDTTKLTFIDCNLRNVDFSFFAEFANMRNLQHLTVNGGSLVRFNSMPFLPNLITIYVGVPDFRQWYDPAMTPNLKNVTLAGLAGERYVEHVLATLWFGYWNTLEGLTIKETSLTRVPSVVNDFYRLHSFDLSSNEMLNHLASGTISARSNPHYLSFANCGIISIESGAFQGNFYNSTINLKGNTLETIDEATFGVVFESMISGGNLGSVSFSTVGPCDCNLSWLLRDHRNYLNFIPSGQCYISDEWMDFASVSTDVFEDCPAAAS